MTEPEQELNQLFPDDSFGDIAVLPFRFGDFKKVLAFVKKYQQAIADSEGDIVAAVMESGEDGLEDLASIALLSAQVEREALDEMPGNVAMDLFFRVFEVNAGFFVQSLTDAAARITRALRGEVGQKSSSSSSPTVTDGQISETTP